MKFHAKRDQRSKTFVNSRSRFKNEISLYIKPLYSILFKTITFFNLWSVIEPLPPDNHNHGKKQNHGQKQEEEHTRVYQVGANYMAPNRPLIKYLNVDKILKMPTYRSNTFFPTSNINIRLKKPVFI